MPPRPFFVPGVSEPTQPLLSRPAKAAGVLTPPTAGPSTSCKSSSGHGDNTDGAHRLPADTSSVAQASEGTTKGSAQLLSQDSPQVSASFADEFQEAAHSIKELTRVTLRERLPYVKTETLEKLLTRTATELLSGLTEQEPEMCAAQSRTTFFSLSAELRNKIYEMALKAENGVRVLQKADVRRHTALLLASRQIHTEAHPIWYGINTFTFDIGEPWHWPWWPFDGETRDGPSPQDVNDWLMQIRPHVPLLRSISLTIRTTCDAQTLLHELLNVDASLKIGRMTVHEAVLETAGVRDDDIATEAFEIVYIGVSRDLLDEEPPMELYKAAGVDVDELATDELWVSLDYRLT